MPSFPDLPLDVLVAHILSFECIPDPADLARLQVVNRAMRDMVGKTGRPVKELTADKAADLAVYHNSVDGMYRLDRRDELFGFLAVDAEQYVYQRFFEHFKWDVPTLLRKLERSQSNWSVDISLALKLIIKLPGNNDNPQE